MAHNHRSVGRCPHISWVVDEDDNDVCADCGYVLIIPEGMHGFLSDESDVRATRIGDFQAREAERYNARRTPKVPARG